MSQLIANTVKKFNLTKKSVGTITISETYGRGLAFKFPINAPGEAEEFIIRFTKLREEWIEYDKKNPRKIAMFRPWVLIGNARQQIEVKPEDAVLFIGEEDPEGNGSQGVPRLLSPYYSILRAENIEEAWAETINIRGMGLVSFLVKDVDDTEELEPYKEAYGDPSSYKTFFHNEQVEVTVHDGMKASFDFDSTMSRFTKNVSSATGYPGTRMEGEAAPAWGIEGDTSNMAEQHSLLHESYEEHIINLIKLCEPRLKTVDFEIDWIYDVKLDERNKAVIRATNASTIMTVPGLILVKEAREMLRLPSFGDERDNMTVEEYMASLPCNQLPEMPMESSPKPPPEVSGEIGGLNSPKPTTADSDATDYQLEAVNAVVDGILQDTPRNTRVETLIYALKEIRVDTLEKDDIARILVHAGDSFEQKLSNNELNDILTPIFGSGKNYNFYADERKKVK